MSLKKISLGCAAFVASAFVSMPAQAACTSTSLPGNNCVTYNTTGGTTQAILEFTDNNLTNNFWQLTAFNATSSYFSDWAYSKNSGPYTTFDPAFVTSGIFSVGTVFTTTTTPSAPASVTNTDPFRIRVTLSNIAPIGTGLSFSLLTSATGQTLPSGIIEQLDGTYSALSRTMTRENDPPSSPVPGPLPLLGAAAAFGYSRKIRKAIRAAG